MHNSALNTTPDGGAAFVLDHGGAGQLNRYVYLK